MNTLTRGTALWLLLACAASACGGEALLSGPSSISPAGSLVPTGPAPPPGASLASAVLLAAGDIGECGAKGAAETGRLLDHHQGLIIAPGDLAYPIGSARDFAECYDPVWGRHKGRTRPAPGNHEYYSPGAQPYFDYFGALAGPNGLGYYSFRAGSWLVLSLNSNVPSGPHSAQGAWVQRELSHASARCVLAYFHHPLVSSGPNGDHPEMAGLWRILHEHGVDVIVNAHDHLYERFTPLSPDGRPDANGIRQFIAGTGGAFLYPVRRVHPGSEVRIAAHGILMLTLRAETYQWDFLDTAGGRGDSGVGACH